MNSIEINQYIAHHRKQNIFKGVFACDNLPRAFSLPAIFIINLSPKNQPGSHWISIYINEIGCCYYFDSFGFPPRVKEIVNFIRFHSKKTFYNSQQLQHIMSKKCGKFCCVFVTTLLIRRTIQSLLKKFSSNLFINELIIDQLFNYFQNLN